MNYFEKSISFEELYKAHKECKKNVSWKDTVQRWSFDAINNIIKLISQLESDTYKVTPPHTFTIFEPKERRVSATHFTDRVFQRSMCNNGLYYELTKGLIYDNCACQKGKGGIFAIKRFETMLHRYYRRNKSNHGFVLKLDIKKYFPTTPHELLKQKLSKVISDDKIKKEVFKIIDEFLKLKWNKGEQDFDLPDFGIRGIGLGSQISQLMELVYLSDIDHFIKEQLHIKEYIRYMDDMIILCETREKAQEIMSILDSEIRKLGLVLNEKSHIMNIESGIPFLKMLFRLSKTGKVTHRVSRVTLNKEVKRIHKLIERFNRDNISIQMLLQHTNSWFGYAMYHCNNKQIKMIRDILHKEIKSK